MQDRASEQFRKKLVRKCSPHDLARVMLAYRLSKSAHDGQKRDGGGRYFEHPRAVALILIEELEIYDWEMLAAALLHDVKEDSRILRLASDDLELIFGKRVRELVSFVSKNDTSTGEKVRKGTYRRRIREADENVRILKLADRLHNMRTLGECSPDKQARIRGETTRYYLRIAEKTNSVPLRGTPRALSCKVE